MHITLRQLRAFEAVAAAASFSQAARTMHLSQAALSGLVKELESQLGVRLLDRNTRQVATSVVGQAFEPKVRRILGDLDEALDGVKKLKELRRGLVRVAAPEPLSCTLMPELIEAFAARYPDVEVRFRDVPVEQVWSGLHDGGIDIGVGAEGTLQQENFEPHALWSDRLGVALHPDDPLAKRDGIRWQDLRTRTVYTYMREFSVNVLSRVQPRHQPGNVTFVHRVNTALSLARTRRAVMICPSVAIELATGFGLVLRKLERPVVSRRISLFARPRRLLSPAVEHFLDFTLEFGRRWSADRISSPPPDAA